MMKLSVALAMAASLAESRSWKNIHPLHQASPEVNSIVREDGGLSLRLHKKVHPRQLSHGEVLAMRK